MGRMSRKSSRPESIDDGTPVQVKREGLVDDELGAESTNNRLAAVKDENSDSPSNAPSIPLTKLKDSRSSSTSSSNRPLAGDREPFNAKAEPPETNGHDSTSTSPVKPEPKEPSKPAKSSRTASKLPPRVAPLFNHFPDVKDEATSTFTVIDACTYQNKYLGFSEHALDCDCAEEWGEFTMHTGIFTPC